ncbi:MAG: flagellar motor protein MotB [Verrucomicrobia bacterium]|nr:flagellar motor protein MotB [Verrucomicrobiota bacterium]
MANAKAKLPPRKKQEPEEGAPSWMVTYGDMMSLLLTFFVLLVSMSVIREEQFEAAKKSIREVFITGFWARTRDLIEDPEERQDTGDTQNAMEVRGQDPVTEHEVFRIKQMIDSRLKQVGLGGIITSYLNVREVRIRIPDRILFGVDSAELKDSFSYEVLYQIAVILRDMDYCINIEGHTATKDLVGGQFQDLWELSSARALTVLRYFEKNGIAGGRLSTVGHGPNQPVADNDSFPGRAKNRRVEIVIRDITPAQFKERSKEEG